jgi:WXG100 family type VII secretion target
MGGAGFTGTVEQFTTAEGQVTEVRSSMDARLSKLRDEIESTRGAWKGDASLAFNRVMDRFDEDGRKINQALQRIADLLREAGSKYEKTEQEQQEIMQAVNRGFDALG